MGYVMGLRLTNRLSPKATPSTPAAVPSKKKQKKKHSSSHTNRHPSAQARALAGGRRRWAPSFIRAPVSGGRRQQASKRHYDCESDQQQQGRATSWPSSILPLSANCGSDLHSIAKKQDIIQEWIERGREKVIFFVQFCLDASAVATSL